ncbi:MAG: YfhO family protein, partial [Lentihominibacter sp.]
WELLAAGVAYYLIAQKLFDEEIDDINLFFYGGIAWLALYCIVMILYRKGSIQKPALMLLIAVLIVSEIASNTCTSFDKVGTTIRSSYFENSEDIKTLAEYTKQEFCRTEIDDTYLLNCPALYHYRGISQFSSSINAGTTALMEKIGIEGEPGKNRFNYNQTDPVTNAMLNIKYLITKDIPLDDPDFVKVKQEGNSSLYESRYPLSIGYMTGNEIRTWNYDSDNPFEVLDDYVRAATSNRYRSVFEPVSSPEVTASNASVENEGSGYITAISDSDRSSRVILEYRADKTQKYYVFVEADNADAITLSKDNPNDDIDIRNDCGSVVNTGVIEKGHTFRIIIDYEEGSAGKITSHVCSLDQEAWDGAYDIMSENMMEVAEYSDTSIRGTVHADESGVLVTSIPYDNGWTLTVDGQKKQIGELTGGVFISVPLDEGNHEILLEFRPPGLMAGSVITLSCVLLLALFELIRRRRRRPAHSQVMMLSGTSPDVSQPGDHIRDFS